VKELKLLEYLKEYLPVMVVMILCLFLIWFINATHFILDLSYDTGTLTLIPNDFTIAILAFLVGFLYLYFVRLTTRLQRQINQLVNQIQSRG
jgi:hypothetical protein